MLIEELFANGTMTMGPSRNDPNRQVGVFAAGALAGVGDARRAALENFRWIDGSWRYENVVPATRLSPPYVDVGSQRFTIAEDGWVCSVAPDGSVARWITYDPLSRQWIYLLTRGSYGMLRSRSGWTDNAIAFSGLMTMIGLDREWRMTWTRHSDDSFTFVNEELAADRTWCYIDEWRFTRIVSA
jgi:hypothetical protein